MLQWFEKKSDTIYAIFRIFVGLLFMQHGLQKIFGLFGGMGDGATAELFSLMWFAGYIELIGGLAVALGFFTRFAALISTLEMAIAYVIAHGRNAIFPIVNKGELAILYFFCFLLILALGAKKWGLEKALLKREIF